MSERFQSTDLALARRLRALEDANDQTIRASAELITTMLDARQARKLGACKSHETLTRLGGIMVDAITLQGKSVEAHHEVVEIGIALGLPLTGVGDACQDYIVSPMFTDLAAIDKAA